MSNTSLSEVLSPELIQLDYIAKDKDDAIRQAGKLLQNENYVEESYIQAMIDSCNKYGSYIVLLPGLAMPHASCENGVLKMGISILRLKEPVVFGNTENDPVKLVIAVATPDNKSHLQLLSKLSQTLFDPEKLNKLNVLNKEEIINLLEV
jgi:mannitol/fructose-specific phosphotransferase system IIA component (Ntr-type)